MHTGSSDPFVRVRCEGSGKTARTASIKDELSPHWDEMMVPAFNRRLSTASPLPFLDLSTALPLPFLDLSTAAPLPFLDLFTVLPLPFLDLSAALPLPFLDLSTVLPLPFLDLSTVLPLPFPLPFALPYHCLFCTVFPRPYHCLFCTASPHRLSPLPLPTASLQRLKPPPLPAAPPAPPLISGPGDRDRIRVPAGGDRPGDRGDVTRQLQSPCRIPTAAVSR